MVTATPVIYSLPLHVALPIWPRAPVRAGLRELEEALPADRRGEALGAHAHRRGDGHAVDLLDAALADRSEEHTSELQSRQYLVCRLLLEKKKKEVQV